MTTLRSQTSGHLPRARHALVESSFVSPVPELHCIASRSQESLRLSEAHTRAPVKQTQKYTVTSAIPCAAHPRRSTRAQTARDRVVVVSGTREVFTKFIGFQQQWPGSQR